MSVIPMDFKITPPKVKPRKGMGLVPSVLKLLACVLGPSTVPLIVYLVEGFSNLFWWMLAFGFIIGLAVLIFVLRKDMDVIECTKINCGAISRRKLPQIPSNYKNFLSVNPSSAARKTPGPPPCQILDGFDVTKSTTPTIVDIPKSIDCSSSRSLSCELETVGVSQQLTNFTPTKRRMISAASVSLSPPRKETKASSKTLPFSNRRLGYSGCIPPRHLGLQGDSCLPTILEFPYADCKLDNLQSRRLSCFSS